jgi:hypothetical protein
MKLYPFLSILLMLSASMAIAQKPQPKMLPASLPIEQPDSPQIVTYTPIGIVRIQQEIGQIIDPSYSRDTLSGNVVDTVSSKSQQKPDSGTICIAIYTGSEGNGPNNKKILEQNPALGTIKKEYVIVCLDCSDQPTIYTNIRSSKASLSGTPAYLSDPEHYFGTIYTGAGDSRPGSGTRVDFFIE